MSLSKNQTKKIKELLSNKIEKKLKSYGRETTSMHFLARLIQDNEKIAAYSLNGEYQKSGNIADFYMKRNGQEYYFEIKTVKPNIDVFEKSKTKLLEWIAIKRIPINVFLAFPYNPYHPKPYHRFTEVGMMDHPNDFLVGDEYWDFIGGNNTFKDLLNVFDEVGREYKDRLNEKFKKIAKDKLDSY